MQRGRSGGAEVTQQARPRARELPPGTIHVRGRRLARAAINTRWARAGSARPAARRLARVPPPRAHDRPPQMTEPRTLRERRTVPVSTTTLAARPRTRSYRATIR